MAHQEPGEPLSVDGNCDIQEQNGGQHDSINISETADAQVIDQRRPSGSTRCREVSLIYPRHDQGKPNSATQYQIQPFKRPTLEQNEETVSRRVSAVLNYFGYHPNTINWRRKSYEDRVAFLNRCLAECSLPFSLYLTGSKEDGTSIWDEGDEDWMLEVDEEKQDNLFVYKAEDITPGYTQLQLATQSKLFEQQSAMNCFVIPSITPSGFLSSQLMNKAFYGMCGRVENCFKDTWIDEIRYDNYRLVKDDSDNPKVVFTFKTVKGWPWHTADIVPAFLYTSPDKYRNWVWRERLHSWPLQPVIEKVLQLPVHVVPKGQKGSDDYAQEFRICYTYAELELMKNLNDTQIKVYLLLKLLFKHVVNKKFPDIITSYMLKNVIFWISEQTPLENFTDELLLNRFQQALKFIIKRLQKGNLPNYFIPERNLFQGRIRPEHKVQLLNMLSEFVSDGPNCVRKIPVIEKGLHAISKDGWEFVGFCRNLVEFGLVYYQMFWCIERESEIKAFLSFSEVLMKTSVG